MGLTATKEAARFDTNEFSLALPPRHVTFLLCIVSLMCINTVTLASSGESVDQYQPRHKRSIIELCDLISIYTPRTCWDYDCYGHHCGKMGWGNSTAEPVDAVDSCCRLHNLYYSSVPSSVCSPIPEHYGTQCTGKSCTCTDSPPSCAYIACSTDLMFAQCLQNATYHQKYKDWNRSACDDS